MLILMTINSVVIEKKWKDVRSWNDRSIGLRYISATCLVVDDSIKEVSGFI